MPVEKSEDSITLRFANSAGLSHELVMPYAKYLELGVNDAGAVTRMEVSYRPLGIRTELVNGRPHKVALFAEIGMISLDRSDLDE